MDEIALTASSALESKESSSPSASGRFLPKSFAIAEGGSALYIGGLQTEIGITSNGGTAALPEESLALAAEAKRGCEPGALWTSTEDGNTAPTLGHGRRAMKKTSPTSGSYPRSDGSFQGSSETSASHFETSWTTSPPELEALP